MQDSINVIELVSMLRWFGSYHVWLGLVAASLIWFGGRWQQVWFGLVAAMTVWLGWQQ
jgi:hypothetical protein